MPYTNPDAEAELESATLALFAELGWETANAFDDDLAAMGAAEVVLRDRLLAALARLNPGLPAEALAQVVDALVRDRSAMALARAHQEVYALLVDGVKVSFRDPAGEEQVETARLVDWLDPENNDFLVAQQFWVTGDPYTKRADLVGFVNGIPLLFGELKAHHKRVEDAYHKNLSDYKHTIPHLFWYSAFLLLSNGSDTRVGTVTGEWGHFNAWKRINDEGETGVISLETAIRGTCDKARFLDLVENFCLHQQSRGGLNVIFAKNHQYLGVNRALDALRQIEHNSGRLGVFWHTQGSGKSFSMVFFCQKTHRKLPGNWTFVVLTDRIDLDDQIYKNFSRTGAVIESEDRVRAQSGEHLQQLLREDHRYVFTLIQKFHTERGERYPVLSERDDIVVITDEAHRTQYDVLAMNMRDALPNAAFLAFTATPLIIGEERTRETFGDYISVYDFQASIADGATVPLYYENRVPEVELDREKLSQDLDRLLEDAELDDAQEARLARQFRDQYLVITRDDRLETVARDIVQHFVNRGHLGKAMVISIDKLTAVKMYDKVQRHWAQALADFRARLAAAGPDERADIETRIAFMEDTDMAVVVSPGQNEVETFSRAGLDMLPHRRRIAHEALDEKFKDPDDPFRLVFVCAMWRTGFDAPACSTIYLDRPMRNHTLMQTIARANRVFGAKNNGLIVDYIGIFRDLQNALAIYGSAVDDGVAPGERPVADKDALVHELESAIAAAQDFCAEHRVDLDPIVSSEGFERIALMDDAVEQMVVNDDTKDRYLALAGRVDKLFKAILPDTRAGDYGPRRHVLVVLADKIRSLDPEADISEVMSQVEDLLDASVSARGYVIRETASVYDLSHIDFDALRERFEKGRKHTEVAKLRQMISAKLRRLVQLNPSRINFLEAFQLLVDAYNQGARNVEQAFQDLLAFLQKLTQEEQRAIAEELTEEELALFDILTRPNLNLTAKDRAAVKKAARDLLAALKREKLVLDWRSRQQARAAVRVAIRDLLWDALPVSCYTDDLCQRKVTAVYQHVYDHYWGAGQST